MGWHVLGAGSLGLLWAVRLASTGAPPTLILRNHHSLDSYARAGGVRLARVPPGRFALPAQTADAHEPIRRLILACKAYDAEAAIATIAHRLEPGAQVLLLQNGLGSQAAVARQIPAARCILLSSTEGAFRESPFSVNFAGHGHNWLGDPGNPEPPDWLPELDQAGIPWQWTPAILARQWHKLAVNCAINPLCTLYNCRNGGLLEHLDEVAGLCDELTRLLQRCAPGEPPGNLFEAVRQIILATADNHCSMLQDVQRRQRTEISYLLGFACARALENALHLPRLDALERRLKQYLQRLGLPDV